MLEDIECAAILLRLKQAVELGFRKVVIESDVISVISKLQSGNKGLLYWLICSHWLVISNTRGPLQPTLWLNSRKGSGLISCF